MPTLPEMRQMTSPSKPMKVLALTRYTVLAASTRQRFAQFVPALHRAGIDVTLSPLLGDKHVSSVGAQKRPSAPFHEYLHRLSQILIAARQYDALWIQYEAFPFLPGPFERLLAIAGRPYVVDYDDAIFHNYDVGGRFLRRLILRRKLAPLLRNAHACVAGNRYLANYTAEYCSNTLIIPTVVDTNRYNPPILRTPGPLRIGWIGSPSTWGYVEPLLHVILPILREFGAVLRVVGARPKSTYERVEFIEWSEDTEIAAVQSFDIGIMPLPDESWARGKCGYKLIQYMSCSVPCIASPVGVNAEIIDPGKNGLLATEPKEWSNALTMLLKDPDLRANMGRNGRDKVIQHYSLASQVCPLINVFNDLNSSRRLQS